MENLRISKLQVFEHVSLNSPEETLKPVCSNFSGLVHQIVLCVLLVVLVCLVFEMSSASDDSNLQLKGGSLKSLDLDSVSFESIFAIANLKSKFDRTRELYNYVHSLSLGEVIELIEQRLSLPAIIQPEAHSVLIERLTQLDPKMALNSTQGVDSDNLIATIFEYWSRVDLDEAIDQLSELEGLERFAALRGLIVLRSDLSYEERIEIGERLGDIELASSMLASLKEEEYLDNPKQSWFDIVEHAGKDTASLDTLYSIASEWYDRSGLSVIDSIAKTPIDNELRNSIIASVLMIATEKDPRSAFELALDLEGHPYNFDSTMYQMTVSGIAFNWAQVDYKNAFDATLELVSDTHLRNELLASIVQVWGQNDPESFLESVDRLPEVVWETGTEIAILKIAQSSPLRAIQLFERLTIPESRKIVAFSIMQNWSMHDSEATLQWVLTNELLDEFRHELLGNLVVGFSPDDVEHAFNAAILHPIEEGQVGLEFAVIYAMSILNLDKAIESLHSVRKGKTSTYAAAVVAARLASSERIEEALGLLEQHPGLDHDTFYRRMAFVLTGEQSSILFGVLDRIPSREQRSNVASTLLYYDGFENTLTKSQVEQLKTYLTENEARKIEDGRYEVLHLDHHLLNW